MTSRPYIPDLGENPEESDKAGIQRYLAGFRNEPYLHAGCLERLKEQKLDMIYPENQRRSLSECSRLVFEWSGSLRKIVLVRTFLFSV